MTINEVETRIQTISNMFSIVDQEGISAQIRTLFEPILFTKEDTYSFTRFNRKITMMLEEYGVEMHVFLLETSKGDSMKDTYRISLVKGERAVVISDISKAQLIN